MLLAVDLCVEGRELGIVFWKGGGLSAPHYFIRPKSLFTNNMVSSDGWSWPLESQGKHTIIPQKTVPEAWRPRGTEVQR